MDYRLHTTNWALEKPTITDILIHSSIAADVAFLKLTRRGILITACKKLNLCIQRLITYSMS